MAHRSLGPITLVIFTFALWRIVQCTVVLRDNGYEGLTFAIHSSVAEDPRLIQNIMDLMTSASEVLYNATHQRTFFRDVTIVVPADWTPVSFVDDDDDHATSTTNGGGGRFEAAEVRVDLPNPAYGNIPYTRQVGACGEPGTFIHITPDFIHDLHGATAEEFGEPVGRTLVHEWSHLRYGVFDEYANDDFDDRSPPTYIDDDGKVQLTGCSKHNCITCDQVNGSYSSLMYLPFLPKADGFCGDSDDRPHNAAAPNAHNLMCQGRSTWEVILSHPDFADGRRRPNLTTTPRFRVVQQRSTDRGIYVLLLDVSGSMSGGRIAMLRRSAARFITAQIPDGARLGMIAFSNAPVILSNLTVVTKDNRDQLVALLPLEDNGGNTGIGSAIRSALHMLNSNRYSSAEGSVIILITDGEENVPPYVRGMVSELVDSKAVVNSVAFGRSASAHLEVLVKSTGGRGFFYENADDFTRHDSALESAFFESATTQADVELRPVQLHRSDVIVSIGGNITERVFVDDETRRNVKFNLGYVDNDIDVVFIDPNGTTYSSRDSDHHVFFTDDPISRTLTFRLAKATTGSWTYMIRNRSGSQQGLSATVTAEPVNVREQPIRIRARMNDVTVRFPDDVTKTKIYAEIFKGYLPVLDALAIATVERPTGSAVEILLKDDGIAADLMQDDGVYSAFFSQYNGTGRYSVTARVVNDGRARLQVGGVTSASPAKRKYLTEKGTSQIEASEHRRYTVTLGYFQRTANAGSFRVSGWVANEDTIPPNRVTDLRATNLIDDFSRLRAIKLIWTSPGDDLDRGTASRLELRVGSLRRKITRVLNSELVLNGSLEPLLGGQTHTILLRPDQTMQNHSLHFVVRFWDDVGNPSQVSNVATVYTVNIFRRQSFEANFARKPDVVILSVAFTALSLPLMAFLMLLFRYCCCRSPSHRKVQPAPVSIIRFYNDKELSF